MAAPPEVNIRSLSGNFSMNKTLSDPFEPILLLQGVGWLTRKAITMGTVTLHINAHGNEIKIEQTLTGGIKGTTEDRVLDWNPRTHTDHIFGTVEGRSRFFNPLSFLDNGEMRTRPGESSDDDTIDPFDLKFLKAQVLADGETPSSFLTEGEFIQTFVINETAHWTAEQIWGFEEIEGTRRYTRRTVVRKKDRSHDVVRARLVYDYLGPVETATE